MKKIILAPAVALAFTGLVASPVAAAESTSAQSTSSQTAEQKKVEAEKAEAKKKADAEAAAKKAEADKKAKEKAAAEKKAAADKKAKDAKAAAKKKADEKKAAEDKADKKDDAKKPPKKVAPKPAPAPKDEDKDAKDDDKSEDKVNPINASVQVVSGDVTAEELHEDGVTVKVTGLEKGDKIRDSLTGKTETADADGDYKLHLWYEGKASDLEAGKLPLTVTIDREGTESETLNGNINIVAEDSDDDGDNPEAPAEATFKVSPKTIEAADFANEKKGVTLAVENCEPGADVHFEVNPKGINVTAYENTVKADDEGNASVNVFGTSSDVSAYVGAYTATATCGDDTMKDSFTVTEGANGGGSGGGDNGNAGNGGDDGSQLPRTGADLGGLTTGALLLLVGGAAIALTGRKNKIGQTPTSF